MNVGFAKLQMRRTREVWGIVSACTMFVKGAASFYAVRFLLGIVESGFFPGVILYLAFWFTSKHRAKMVAGTAAAPLVSALATLYVTRKGRAGVARSG